MGCCVHGVAQNEHCCSVAVVGIGFSIHRVVSCICRGHSIQNIDTIVGTGLFVPGVKWGCGTQWIMFTIHMQLLLVVLQRRW